MPRLLPPLALAFVLAACGGDRPAATDSVRSGDPAVPATAGGDTALQGSGSATVPPATVPGAPAGATTAPGAVAAGSATAPAGAPATVPGTATSTSGGSVVPADTAAPLPATSGAASDAGTATAGPPPTASVIPAPPPSSQPAAAGAARRAPVPFLSGERLVYDVKFSAIDVGDGTMEVRGVESVRGRDAYHILFRVKGGTLVYKVNDRYESWIDVETLSSLRHIQDIDEGNYERKSTFEIFPERSVYRENQKPERPSVGEPLDDASFLYFVRTIPLEVGKSYEFPRYFRPDRNPVRIRVLRRERVTVPAGTFDAVVLQPIIKSKGLFSEGGEAQIWIAADSTRMMVQMKSKLPIGSLNLYLKNVRRSTP